MALNEKLQLYFTITEEKRECSAIRIIVTCEVCIILLTNTLLLEYFKMDLVRFEQRLIDDRRTRLAEVVGSNLT